MKNLLILVLSISVQLFSQPLLIIGHRGACGYEPENTLRSFQRAIDMGIKMIELDVFVCASGELVVIHDQTLERTTNGIGNVEDLTWKSLQHLDAGKGERIPLLSQVLDLVDKRIILNIELKGAHTEKPVANLIHEYVKNRAWSYENFVVSSFDHYAVCEFHELCPQVKTGVIFECNPIGYADIVERAQANYAINFYESLTKEFIDDAHSRGIRIFAYTVNTKPLAIKLQQLGIDGIFTNYPDLFN